MNFYVVVLAWNHWEDTRECLDSLQRSQIDSAHVILVDNGSSDGTGERVRSDFPDVELISLPENIGINRGYNVGMERALVSGAAYVVAMNNDTSADPLLLAELRAALDADSRVAVAVPKIVSYDDPQRIWSAGARWRAFPPGVKLIGLGQLDGARFSNPVELEFATSCCLMIRAAALQAIGFFDPAYIFYFDDWDFCLRVRCGGYKLMYVPRACLRHKVSLSTHKAGHSNYWAQVQGRDSVLFYLRHRHWLDLMMMTGWTIGREMITGKVGNVLPYLLGVKQGLNQIRQQGLRR